ncbi:MAG: ROK family protein [Armatimonadetes bacterium]|nr:ROK family protein [Armatimonadota bacterium]
MEPAWVLGVDVGGTRISAGLVSRDGALRGLVRESTPRSEGGPRVLSRLLDIAHRSLESGGQAPAAIGIGFGGPVDFEADRPRLSHHVGGWGGVDIAGAFRGEFGLPVVLENDANAGGLGEAVFGAARGFDPVLYVNIGTGVGGAVIVNGRILHGAHGNAGEFGHMVVDPHGPVCTCGKRGCVEAFCSGEALGREARQALQSGVRFGDEARQDITGVALGALAAAGDPEARRLVETSASRMGFALALAANLIDPAVIVLGGGVPEMGEVYLEPVREAFRRYAMDIPAERTSIVAAQLGYNAGIVGAAAVALQHFA